MSKKKHGYWGTPTYLSWFNMKQRCLNPNMPGFRLYGGRGIRICKRWIQSFENFLSDMGERPSGKSLGRINNDGPYTPKNCEWQTPKEQAQVRHNRTLRAFCRKGHALAPGKFANGRRYCLICFREYQRNYKRAHPEIQRNFRAKKTVHP
jgi:hypothetical protein